MMQKYCEATKESIFDILPVTFYVEIMDIDKSQDYNKLMQPFVQFYQTLEENRTRFHDMQLQIKDCQDKLASGQFQEHEEDSDNQATTDNPSTTATNKD